jgi:hypothetical protein
MTYGGVNICPKKNTAVNAIFVLFLKPNWKNIRLKVFRFLPRQTAAEVVEFR